MLGEIEGATREQMGRLLGVNGNTAYSRLLAARRRFAEAFPDPADRDAVSRACIPRPRGAKQRVWIALGASLRVGAPVAVAGSSKVLAGVAAAGVLLLGAVVTVRAEPPSPTESLADPEPSVRRTKTDTPTTAASTQEPAPAAVSVEGPREHLLPTRGAPSRPRPHRSSARVDRSPPKAIEPIPSDRPHAVNATVTAGIPALGLPDLAPAMAKLDAARRAVREGRPGDALESLARSDALDPDGVFATERAVTRVWALCGTGRGAEARREVARLQRDGAASAYTEVLSRSCVGDLISSARAGDQGR